jgi:hypothetical protein
MPKETDDERNQARRRLHATTGELNYILERFGDKLAKDKGYKDLDGMEAIWLYFIKTYHWTPAYVKSMNSEDIRFVLSQEMQGFTISG